MAEHESAGASAESFWTLLLDVARLQRLLGRDMAAWAHVYQLAGEAMQGNADTLNLMAELGLRSERFMRTGPPAAARQAMQMFMNPLGMMGPPGPSGQGGGAGPASPFMRFWEAWASNFPGGTSGE